MNAEGAGQDFVNPTGRNELWKKATSTRRKANYTPRIRIPSGNVKASGEKNHSRTRSSFPAVTESFQNVEDRVRIPWKSSLKPELKP